MDDPTDHDGEQPVPPFNVFSVSPDDHSSDREQSDADQAVNVESNTSDREQSDADHVITVAKIDGLIDSNREVATSANALALAAVEYQERAGTARKRFRIMVGAFGAVVLMLMLSVLVVVLVGAAQRNTIRDCVDPSGQCFKDGQARIGKAVDSINQVSVLAAACAPDYVTLPLPARTVAIQNCIKKSLGG